MIEVSHQIGYRLYRALWTGLDWIYPPQCGGCDRSGFRWCAACKAEIQPFAFSGCSVCGDHHAVADPCLACSRTYPQLRAISSVGVYRGPVRKALHRLKYKEDIGLGESLARELTQHYLSMGWEIDLIVPVPLSKARKSERGYNQVALLALPLAMQVMVPYRPKALSRVVHTRSQVGLSACERRENVQNAFVADSKVIDGRSVLLLDDVITTGATLIAGAEAMITAGARAVFGLTLARAVRR